jgi:hypothetical protein
MNEIVDFYTAALPRSPHSESRLREEIAFLEVKARELSCSADCAYEKSLARTYSALLQARRAELARFARH